MAKTHGIDWDSVFVQDETVGPGSVVLDVSGEFIDGRVSQRRRGWTKLADIVPTVALDHVRLTELLQSSPEEAQQRAAIQLRRGAPFQEMDFFWEEGHELAATYSGRAEQNPDTSQPVLGIEEALALFREHPTDVFTTARLDGDDGYHYLLFISVEDRDVIACIASPVHS